MPITDDLIRFENEHTALDFKAVQYSQATHQKFLTDVLAFANADVDGDRHIIVGVKHNANGEREILGIQEAFADPAIYQQLVRENIEPELTIDYQPHEIDGKRVGVFVIGGCDNPPYQMRKDFGTLKRGDGFIRKGSHQPRVMREDFERIYAKRTSDATDLGRFIAMAFDVLGHPTHLQVHRAGRVTLPSKREGALIERELAKRPPGEQSFPFARAVANPFEFFPYEKRDTSELRRNLASIKKDYASEDKYLVYERAAEKLNIVVLNNGERYIHDATLVVRIPRIEGLLVARHIYQKPDYSPRPIYIPNFADASYPDVKRHQTEFEVTAHMGPVKHRRVNLGFGEKLRVFFGAQTVGRTVVITCSLYAKNLASPVEQSLSIEVLGREPE